MALELTRVVSTTAPSLLPLKDGASWAALEYAKNIRSPEGKSLSGEGGGTIEGDLPDVTIAIAGISYTDKTKYRSGAVMKFAPSVRVADYVDEFLGEDPKAAVKRMTADIDRALRGVTINAPDFDTLTAAHMARKILWVNERSLPLRHLRDVGQTLVDMFSPEATATSEAAMKVKQTLLAYDAILRETGLTHHALSGVPLPETLDPSVPHPMPTRARALGTLILQTLRSLVYLAFFAFPLVVHLPLYAIARFSTKLSPDEEDISQNKIATGLVIALFVYSTVFALVYAWQPPAITVTSPTASLASLLTTAVVVPLSIVIGAIVAAGLTSLFVMYHNRTVTRNYDGAKRLVAGWRVLAGLWTGSETNVRRALKIRAAAAVELRSYIRTQADVSPRAAQLVAYGARLSSSPATAAALRSDVTNRQRRATSGSDTSASTPKLVHRFSATSVETSSLPPTPSLASDFATGFSPAS